MKAAARLVILSALLVCLCPAFRALGDDDTLPNFNAPQDNSPLNIDKVNRILGVTMFQSPSLWDENAAGVAKRLGWPEESRTSTQSSYRLYPAEEKPVSILGARAYSCVLYATQDKPTEASIVFVNAGDYEWSQKYAAKMATWRKSGDDSAPPPSMSADDRSDIDQKVQGDFEKALKQDAQTLTDALTKLFGDPVHEGFGGGSETTERVVRWDWQGHSFLLSSPKGKYVALRIVPVSFAESNGTAEAIPHDDLKALLLQRVKKTDPGDVVVSDIPMVDQGPKGYCVPATWERYLRFLGVPADMYVLAMAAGTAQGGGTDLNAMVANVESLVTLYHRKIDTFYGDLNMKMISGNIDKGFPLMWTCFIHEPFDQAISKRMQDRNKVTDWNAWAAKLDAGDDQEIAREITAAPSVGGHQRMIIGYNDKTQEIAISDSWSKAFAIRWMTLKEANQINAGQSYVISF